MSEEQIKRKFGEVTDIIGGGWLNLEAGEVTDDTQMTMCVMNALMRTLNEYDPLGYLFMIECRKEFIMHLVESTGITAKKKLLSLQV